MRKTFSLMVGLIAFTSISTFAQQAPRAATPTAPASAQTAPPPAHAATPAPVDPRIDQSDVNIGVTVNITDKSTGGTQNKLVSLIVANRNSGRVRSSGTSFVGDRDRQSDLNVDARTTLMKSGVISVDLTINYMPEWTSETTKMTLVTQSVTLFLKDGVPTVITQAADPTKGTRSVTIEVTAKVIR